VTLAKINIISRTNMNKEIKWICELCEQVTRSKSDDRQIGCEVCNIVAEE
jgi:hypothetical protein